MTAEYAMEVVDDYLHVIVEGVIAKTEDVLGFAVPLRRKAEELGLKRILVDCRKALIQFSFYDSVQLAKHVESSAFIYRKLRVVHLIAPEHVQAFADYQTPAANRGFFFESFTDLENALAWLRRS